MCTTVNIECISLLTDGGTEIADDVFNQTNWNLSLVEDFWPRPGRNEFANVTAFPAARVRVYAYALGMTTNPTSAIRNMACKNRGTLYASSFLSHSFSVFCVLLFRLLLYSYLCKFRILLTVQIFIGFPSIEI